MDQYGNYVVQFVVSICDYDINKIIVINLLKDFQKFSSQKYSSNVIEKILDCCNDETKQMIVETLCEPKLVSSLLFDMYGNYVLQKTMSIANEPYRTKFIQMVGPYLENLKMLTFGLKLYNKLLTSFPELYAYTKSDMFAATANANYKKRNKKQKPSQNPSMPMQMNPSIGLQPLNPQMNMFMQQNPNMMNNHNINMNSHYSNMFYQPNNQFYNNAFPSNTFRNVQAPQAQLNPRSNMFNIQPNYDNNTNTNFLQQNAFMSQNVVNPSSVYYNQQSQNIQGGNFMQNYYK